MVARLVAMAITFACICPALASDDGDSLKHAIHLFNSGQYVDAQEALTGIDREQLTSDEQAQRDEYLGRVQQAIALHEKALRDLEDAETAIIEQENSEAAALLQAVLDNEYAAPAIREYAQATLDRFSDELTAPSGDSSGESAAQSTDTQRAKTLVNEARDMVRAGRYDEAQQLYQQANSLVTGFPEAVDGLAELEQHRRNAFGSRSESLADRIRREDLINWQRTVAHFQDAAGKVRAHVTAERFDEANQMLVRSRQIVEAGRQYADPRSKYDALHGEVQALATLVRDKERVYHEQKVAQTRREVEQLRNERLSRDTENRKQQVATLMEQAVQHRKDNDLEAAINVLRQVTVIDPKYREARWLIDTWEDDRAYRREKGLRETNYRVTRDALLSVEEAKIPWWTELKYPKDWPEIIARDERVRPGQSRDMKLISALDKPIRPDFDRVPFDEVIERLAQANNINILPNWKNLANANVDRKSTIDLRLPAEISLKKTLTEVLDQASGQVQLGFVVSEGVISIATQAHLDQKTETRVYDISDLLFEIPELTNAPMMDLRNMTPPSPFGNEREQLPWVQGDDDDDHPEIDINRNDRVSTIINLIMDTIAPESWRDRGGSIGMMRELNNQLVVTQNAATQQRVSGLLDRLREERSIQIAVEALFITVSSHYLEELGIDLDIILNNGSAGFDFVDSGSGPATDAALGSRLLLPRSFSRLGFTPNAPAGLGTGLVTRGTGAGAVNQPFNNPALVPRPTGGSGGLGTPIPVQSGLLGFTDPANLPSDVPGSLAGSSIAPALNVFGSFLDNIQVDFLIRATQADSRTSVVTAPRLVVFNGGSAWVAVTIQQNFISRLQPVVAQGAVAQAPVIGTIDAGASLFVRATVTADRRYVMMLLAPGVTRLLDLQSFPFSGGTGANSAFVQLATLSSQRIQTVVSVPDGGTLLIGGQKLASETEAEAGVPILSKIPILKRLYSARSMAKDEQILLILIKPKVLIQSEQEEKAFPSFTSR